MYNHCNPDQALFHLLLLRNRAAVQLCPLDSLPLPSLPQSCGGKFGDLLAASYLGCDLDEPIDSSISYLCVGLYIGSFFDALSFYKESSLIFCTLTLGLILYLIVQFLKSRGVARFRQAFTSE
jgi:hypothetical protein